MTQNTPFDKKWLFCKTGEIVELLLHDPEEKSDQEHAGEAVIYFPKPSNKKEKLELPVTIWMCTTCKYLPLQNENKKIIL